MTMHNHPALSPAWKTLTTLARTAQNNSIGDYFTQDPARIKKLSLQAAGLSADFTRHHVNNDILSALCTLAQDQQLPDKIQQLFAAKPINITENRPALHMALRGDCGNNDIQTAVQHTQHKIQALCEQLHQGLWQGFSGKAITDIVNLGIGGSDLGPRMATTALQPYHNDILKVHYVANMDPSDIDTTLNMLNPETTLFIIVSKSWSTLETLSNADTAKAWLQQQAGEQTSISNHFIAISSRPDRCTAYGIDEANILPMWDWVGGRYSLWSAVGLSIALATSFDCFQQLLAGANAMDQHFASSPFEQNMPVIMALLEVWYTNFWHCSSLAVLPYHHHLRLLPNHLQQLIMESNGKRIDLNGQLVNYNTSPIIWGTAGSNGQHSFHQLLHQGTQIVPVDFILPLKSHSVNHQQQEQLVANCLAQAEILMDGQNMAQLTTALSKLDEQQLNHRVIPGNKPSTLITMELLTPQCLGALIALYEHKTFAASVIWNINAFDQWGVELGKVTSSNIYSALSQHSDNSSITNPATTATIAQYLATKNNRQPHH